MQYVLHEAKLMAQGIEVERVVWMNKGNHAEINNSYRCLFDGYALDPDAKASYDKELARLTELANGECGRACGEKVVKLR